MATTSLAISPAALSRREKWELLSPHLRRHGREALSYATLQGGMEYFVDALGYIAYNTVRHPILARRPRRIVFSDPICDRNDLQILLKRFLADCPFSSFGVISEFCAEMLRDMGFKVNSVGYEPELHIPTYNTLGDWKSLDLIKRARNEAKREGITIREEPIENLNPAELKAVCSNWISSKLIHDREIWIYARRPVFEFEEDVRKFFAFNKLGQIVGLVFYDPMYQDGRVFGYSANIVRCDENRYGKLATAIHMTAIEKFKEEGKMVLNLCLAPFVKLELGKFNDDFLTRKFFSLSERYGNRIYNFRGLSFHKSKYRGTEKPLYYASNRCCPSNDVYLAFLAADITRNYFSTLGRLLWGMLTANHKDRSG
jgi:lysylphosphatidylglycerol synthetase-like protein (DUF2156 family)